MNCSELASRMQPAQHTHGGAYFGCQIAARLDGYRLSKAQSIRPYRRPNGRVALLSLSAFTKKRKPTSTKPGPGSPKVVRI